MFQALRQPSPACINNSIIHLRQLLVSLNTSASAASRRASFTQSSSTQKADLYVSKADFGAFPPPPKNEHDLDQSLKNYIRTSAPVNRPPLQMKMDEEDFDSDVSAEKPRVSRRSLRDAWERKMRQEDPTVKVKRVASTASPSRILTAKSIIADQNSGFKKMSLNDILFNQGFGSRSECRDMILRFRVKVAGNTVNTPDRIFDTRDLQYSVDKIGYVFNKTTILMLNKPLGYEVTHKSQFHKPVFDLLPPVLQRRKLHASGRLDTDSSGLLILTNDTRIIQLLTMPNKSVPKKYLVTVKHPINDTFLQKLRDGVQLHGELEPVFAEECTQISENEFTITITSGLYHQVRRMVGAASNRCVGLHRLSVGSLVLPEDLKCREFRILTTDELKLLLSPYQKQPELK